MALLDRFEVRAECIKCRGPIDRKTVQDRGGGTVGRCQWSQCFPALWARHPRVYRIIRIWSDIDRLALRIEMNLQATSRRTEATDRLADGGRFCAAWNLPQPKIAGLQEQLTGHRAVAFAEWGFIEYFHTATRWACAMREPF